MLTWVCSSGGLRIRRFSLMSPPKMTQWLSRQKTERRIKSSFTIAKSSLQVLRQTIRVSKAITCQRLLIGKESIVSAACWCKVTVCRSPADNSQWSRSICWRKSRRRWWAVAMIVTAWQISTLVWSASESLASVTWIRAIIATCSN